jgi:hypothetical protein
MTKPTWNVRLVTSPRIPTRWQGAGGTRKLIKGLVREAKMTAARMRGPAREEFDARAAGPAGAPLADAVRAGLITPNQARAKLGLAPVVDIGEVKR